MKAQTEMEVWVIDQSKEALHVAKERCEQIELTTPKTVHYAETIDGLPTSLDFVVVATGSKPRAAIVKSLLSHSSVKYLVLEKFLFTRICDYDEIGTLLKEKGVKCWVNCARRMDECYIKIRDLMDQDKPVSMEYCGQNWGMCCNSVHFIDIWMYMAGNSPFEVDMTEVEPHILESKRICYIELMGKETFKSVDGDQLTLVCSDKYEEKSVVKITNGVKEIIVDEAKGEWYYNGETHQDRLYYQSEMTGMLADEIFNTGDCHLVAYDNSADYHKPYLLAVMNFVNKLQGTMNDSCPIT
jgi:hypothetical protein